VVNLHTLKPLDKKTIIKAALETGAVVTAEEHQVGGLGNYVSSTILEAKEVYKKPILFGMIGVKDRFGESGQPWELIKEFEVSAEHIAQKAKQFFDLKKSS
jgi:transketolase